MNTEIPKTSLPQMPAAVDRSSPDSAAPRGIAHPDIKAPVKPDIQYDPAQMRRQLEESLKRLNAQLEQSGRNLNFSMDQSTHAMVIVVKNNETGEVIRKIPGDAALNVAHNIDSLKGLMFNSHS